MFSLQTSEIAASLRQLIASFAANLSRPHLLDMVLPPSVPTLRDLRRRLFQRRWMGFIESLIAKRLLEAEPDEPRDLLDMLRAARDPETGQGFTRAQLRDQVATLILAGHETTAVTLFWAFTLLAQDGREQERCAEEALAVELIPTGAGDGSLAAPPRHGPPPGPAAGRPEDRLRRAIHDFLDFTEKAVDGRAKPGHDGGALDKSVSAPVGITPDNALQSVQALPRIRAVLNETLRLYPPAFTIVREAIGQDRLCGIEIPPRSIVMIAPWVLHRHRRLWRDPDVFDPSRFMPDAPPPPRFAFLPFGTGPRVCVGAQFALTEAAIVLATLLPRLRVALRDPPPTPLAVVTTQPDRPPLFELRQR